MKNVICLILFLITFGLGYTDYAARALWPTFCAVLLVFLFRSAFWGLLAGALVGTWLIAAGDPAELFKTLWATQLVPIFQSKWKLSALGFTLILGGFVALIEAGGGLRALLQRVLGPGGGAPKRTQATVSGFGLLVFFDGLANSMLVGRLMRSAVDRNGVSREKLAYLADATASSVACLAFISTWIAFQLAMIREGLELAGVEASAYSLFFRSLPMNFYCWFTLAMVLVCIFRNFNPGPMGKAEAQSRRLMGERDFSPQKAAEGRSANPLVAVIPIAVLVLSVPVLSYWIGRERLLPLSFKSFAEAYSRAEGQVPYILLASSIVASLTAGVALFFGVKDTAGRRLQRTSEVFLVGVRDLLGPVCILLAAWMLGSAIGQLGLADLLGAALRGNVPPTLLPLIIFLTGAAISFSTGTSWGTMAVLMPLAIPVIYVLTGGDDPVMRESLVLASIGAVFSGAVFGDHCSPLSDTTIVASIATGIEPLDHVRTQMPFALLAAGTAVLVGFVPIGFGLAPVPLLLLGAMLIALIPTFAKPGPASG